MYASNRRITGLAARLIAGLALVLAAGACDMSTAVSNFLAVSTSPVVTAPLDDAKAVPDVKMAFHGNWCGPHHPTDAMIASGKALPPIDRLDAACRKHDLCYIAKGNRPHCGCDRDFIWRIKYLQYHDPDFSDDARGMAFLMLAWLEASACSSDEPGNRTARRADTPRPTGNRAAEESLAEADDPDVVE